MNNKMFSLMFIALSSLIVVGCSSSTEKQNNIALAQCLTEKGAIMYGTNRCSHCNAQKEAFGYEAFAKINFVDCDRNKNVCDLAGIKGYPTWIFADKSKLEGEQALDNLAKSAGCEYTSTESTTTNTQPTVTATVATGTTTVSGTAQ